MRQQDFVRRAGENSHPSLLWSRPYPLNHNGSVTSDNGLSEQLLETEETNAVETGTTSDNNDALESQPANEQRAQELDPAVIGSEDSTERRNREEPPEAQARNFGPIDPANIKKEKTSLTAGVDWEAQGRTDCNQPSAIIVIGSEDSTEHRNREETPEASMSAEKRPAPADLGKPPTLQKAKRRRRARQYPDVPVDFKDEILPVTCREVEGNLIKRKLERGVTVKCIRSEDGNWFTPREFEEKGDLAKASNWKTSLMCGGKTLKWLMENGKLPKPQTTCGRNKKGGNPNKCKICQDGGKLFRCEKCRSFFHGDCHLPPVDTKGISLMCTICTIENSSRSQQRYKESDVLVKPMGPEEKLKCDFLLLRVYQHLETIVFQNIPHENYVKEASQCLERLRKLDDIKSHLTNKTYSEVNGFVQAMNNFFTVPECNDSDLTKKEFEKNFKKIFAIQETNLSNSLV
ncbi:nuclear body protein SP140-like [Pteronotus mesoamericanus]|uniref:nuclear body protein SP140-like n=1 Tax=Pteronotus mesoamericanus TaxID=1884717 RepID=UPI0023ED621D|nr:nuclear body protein SP140-like [Pteronotus parnellii mesoamericanus]